MPKYLLHPIPEIFEAAAIMNEATNAHLSGNREKAALLFKKADMPEIRNWTESIWGAGGIYSEHLKRLGNPPKLSKELLDPKRMPNKQGERELLQRDGHFCRFCGIPVIRKEVRSALHKMYSEAIPWGKTNSEQHAAFQAMWVQYDHLIPHARGGRTTLENMVITCAPCNYGRMNFLVEEVGLTLEPKDSINTLKWDGLERVLTNKNKTAL